MLHPTSYDPTLIQSPALGIGPVGVGVGVVDVSEIVGVDVTGMGVKVGVEPPTTVIEEICAAGQFFEENQAPPFRCKSKCSVYMPFVSGAEIGKRGGLSVVGGLPILVAGR